MNNRRLSKQEFFDRLGPAAVGFLLTAAKSDVAVEAWIKRLDLVTPEPDGTSVDLDDPRTVAGVSALGATMLSLGVVEAGWVDSVLESVTLAPVATESGAFVATHAVQGLGLAMIDGAGTVRLSDGRWTTLEALIVMKKTVEAI